MPSGARQPSVYLYTVVVELFFLGREALFTGYFTLVGVFTLTATLRGAASPDFIRVFCRDRGFSGWMSRE